jgi:hypothetical protein
VGDVPQVQGGVRDAFAGQEREHRGQRERETSPAGDDGDEADERAREQGTGRWRWMARVDVRDGSGWWRWLHRRRVSVRPRGGDMGVT